MGKRLDQTARVRPTRGPAGGPEVHDGSDLSPSLIKLEESVQVEG